MSRDEESASSSVEIPTLGSELYAVSSLTAGMILTGRSWPKIYSHLIRRQVFLANVVIAFERRDAPANWTFGEKGAGGCMGDADVAHIDHDNIRRR